MNCARYPHIARYVHAERVFARLLTFLTAFAVDKTPPFASPCERVYFVISRAGQQRGV